LRKPGVDERIILILMLNKMGLDLWTELILLRIWFSGGLS
jgi:hypothetical protein